MVGVTVSAVGVSGMLSHLQNEQQTWQLVISLYQDRLNNNSDILMEDDISVGQSVCDGFVWPPRALE